MACPLTALANIISSQVDVVSKAYTQNGRDFPGLDNLSQSTPLDTDPSLVENKALIAAAAAQILAMVSPPPVYFTELSFGMYGSALLAFVVDTNIADILKKAGPAGLHVKDIAAENGVDASYIARVLRWLATRHVFQELSPDVFANNSLSAHLVKAKSLEEIHADPIARFDDAPVAAFISRNGDEALRSSVYLSSFLQNQGEHAAPFNIAFKTETKSWDWYEEPDNNWRARRFSAVMKDFAGKLFDKADLIDSISAASINKDDLIVDVGGNIGKLTHALHQEMPQYRYVVQDLDTLIERGKQFWNEAAPDALASGRVDLQVHNFFDPQPIKGAGIYFLRFIMHDWPDKNAKVILQHLRDAASSSSKLIICDSLAFHTCESSYVTNASGNKAPPYPLLPCLGIAGTGSVTNMDAQMLNLYNGIERTEGDFIKLGAATGWKFQSVIKNTPLPCFLYSPM